MGHGRRFSQRSLDQFVRSENVADRVALESPTGEVLEELREPRATFAGHTLETPWSALQLAYFAGCAMWTYLNTPFLLAHPGGPFWKDRDLGAWTIPKGEIQSAEEPLAAAIREFGEELGFQPQGTFIPLTPVQQKSGKIVHAWAFEGDCDTASIKSNTFKMEWPPKSGRMQEFPEVDRAAWFTPPEAGHKILRGQIPILEALYVRLGVDTKTQPPR
jgi:predicted NUDIX family NTP pyrophosphohydrolase